MENNPGSENISKKGLAWFYAIQCVLLLLAMIALMEMGNYGWTLFCIIPFSIGLTVGIYTKTYKSGRLLKGSVAVCILVGIISALLLIGGLEGAICILMALGLIILPALSGLAVGFFIRNIYKFYSLAFIFLLNTSSYVYDKASDVGIESVAVQSVIVKAAPGKIWNVLIHPVKFKTQTNFFFKAGVSYPLSMQLQNCGSGKCKLFCTLNNGRAKLNIEKLDSLRLLRFSIPNKITPMKELSFYDSLDAPHLSGYFQPLSGEFLIEKIDATTCRLTARTCYRYKITPAFYWQWWSDYLVNTMHRHVLDEIKSQSE